MCAVAVSVLRFPALKGGQRPDGARLVLELDALVVYVTPTEGRREHVARAFPIHRCRDPRGPVILG